MPAANTAQNGTLEIFRLLLTESTNITIIKQVTPPSQDLIRTMAQGAIKKKTQLSFASKAKQKPQQKRGARVVKPKKAKSTTADKVTKKFTAGLIGKTEALLGERAGHLELIGKGKKAEKKADSAKKGGTKKFG